MSISQDKNLQNILDILKQHPTATAKQLAQILHDIPIRTLQYRLKRLVEAQHVLQIGKGPAAKYQLPPTKAAPIIAISKKGGEIQNYVRHPDPFRLRYHIALREVVAEVVRGNKNKQEAFAYIAIWATQNIAEEDQEHFREVTETELLSLHEGNFARYQLRPSEFTLWQQQWARPNLRSSPTPA